jgi:hypothetical protein
MFNTYNQEHHTHEHVNIKMPEIPTKYDVYNHNQNDDINRMDFYLRNNISSNAMQSDLLRDVIDEINYKVNEYIMKYYDGKEKRINVTVKESFKCTALKLPSKYELLDNVSKSIERKYNINNRILLSDDFLDGSITIMV